MNIQRSFKKFGYFFFALMLCTITASLIAKGDKYTKKQQHTAVDDHDQDNSNDNQLPDEESVTLSSILSAIGGFSGGGLFLIFLIRRLISSYDESFAKWENRCSVHSQQQNDKNNKMIEMIEEIHGMATELKMEMVKIQANSVNKDSITESFTKVKMLEDDINQVRDEIKSIMTHLIRNKPKAIARS